MTPPSISARLERTEHGYRLTLERDGEMRATLIDSDFWELVTARVTDDARKAAQEFKRRERFQKATAKQTQLFGDGSPRTT